jgi:tRNA (guanine-N7-)-methyltransferase
MSRSKIAKYQANHSYPHLIQADTTEYQEHSHLSGNRTNDYFKNTYPIVLELGCGKAEHSIYGSQTYINTNRIGIDIKWERLYHAASYIAQQQLNNVALLRLNIHNLLLRFGPQEVDEILISFPDPRPKIRDEKRRLTNYKFLDIYRYILKKDGFLKFKSDDKNLYEYSIKMLTEWGRTIIQQQDVWILTDFFDISSQFATLKGWIKYSIVACC